MSHKVTLNKQNNQTNKFNFYLIPIIIAMVIIPLIVRSHQYDSKLAKYPWFSSDGNVIDVFLYWKSFSFILISFIITGIIIYKLSDKKRNIKFSRIFLPLCIYAILTLLSSVLSKYSYFSFHGIYEQFESVWVLIGYCVLTYYAFLVVNTENDLHIIIRCLLIGITIICLIGISQLISHDFYSTTLGKLTYLSSADWNNIESTTFSFEAGRVYMSLYNPNYVGSYVVLMIPLLLVLTFFNRNLKYTFIYIILILSLALCLFGSQSRSGIIALAASLLLMLILFRKYIFKKWKYITLGCTILILAFFITNLVSNNILLNRVINMFQSDYTAPLLSEIRTNNDNITITYNNEPLKIQYEISDEDGYDFTLTDKAGKPVLTQIGDNGFDVNVNDKRFPNFMLAPVEFPECMGFLVQIDGYNWYFTNQTKDNTYYYYTSTGKYDKINNPDKVLINENFATHRGYIWSRTIPLLSKNIIIGSGADTFSLVYPNDDYVGLFNNGYVNTIMTKPHNMFLQMSVQTGMLSLIAFLIFFGIYFISSIRIFINHKFDSFMSHVGVGILLSTTGYMVAGLTNDSTIAVAPIFWALIGIGIGVNYKLKHLKNGF